MIEVKTCLSTRHVSFITKSEVEVYQLEGSSDSRVFLGGGKPYSTGYAQVAKASSAPGQISPVRPTGAIPMGAA